MKKTSLRILIVLSALLAAALLAGCGPDADEGGGKVRLEAWAHAGQEAERRVLEGQLRRFNAAQDSLRVELTFLPEGSYNAQVQAAAQAGELPDILEIDGPFVASYAWRGHLRALDALLPAALRAEILPSLLKQGRYGGRLYAVGTFDSGLGLYARRSALAGSRVPAGPGDAWAAEEFEALLDTLAAADPDGAVLDMKLNYAGEWYTYAYSPLIQSAGGDLVHRGAPWQAAGALDGPAAVAAMERVQGWIERGRVDPNLDDAAFASGRVPLAFGGHWNYARYAEAWGEDLLLLPLPDFGAGSRTGMGSWCWTLGKESSHPAAAATFLRFLLEEEEVLKMADANGAVPGTRAALARSPRYGKQGPLRLFADQLLGGFAVPRPRTPAYHIITDAFQEAFDKIRGGGDVQAILDEAAASIDLEIADNDGFADPRR